MVTTPNNVIKNKSKNKDSNIFGEDYSPVLLVDLNGFNYQNKVSTKSGKKIHNNSKNKHNDIFNKKMENFKVGNLYKILGN